MEENRASQVKTVTLMFVGGAVLGAIAGLLLAPKSGEETRKEIKDYASKVKGDVVDAAQRTKAGIEAAMEKGRALLSESKAA
ncbi:MAG: YtxH domain-containing protein [Nitrospirae bacterium]|nr:MAG: YtxH domain-containing protein [Nitrospirota bacterium]